MVESNLGNFDYWQCDQCDSTFAVDPQGRCTFCGCSNPGGMNYREYSPDRNRGKTYRDYTDLYWSLRDKDIGYDGGS